MKKEMPPAGQCPLDVGKNRFIVFHCLLSLSLFYSQPAFKGLTFTDLPLCLQLNIMQRLTDGRDLVSIGQVAPSLQVLSEDRLLWKKLCHYHFTDRQVRDIGNGEAANVGSNRDAESEARFLLSFT